MRNNPASRGSVGQVLDKGFLGAWINKDEEIRQVLHFAQEADLLTIDDPLFLFYVRNVPWREFARELGFVSVAFERRYDFALSFAGKTAKSQSFYFWLVSQTTKSRCFMTKMNNTGSSRRMWRSICDRSTRVKHSLLSFFSGETTRSEFGRRLNRTRSERESQREQLFQFGSRTLTNLPLIPRVERPESLGRSMEIPSVSPK